jgi:hypothetical protein
VAIIIIVVVVVVVVVVLSSSRYLLVRFVDDSTRELERRRPCVVE